ncbi:hypothetical protein BDQ17DRAFT_1327168 [Cyathus striatus]|nr:hypothetical protein BDQ17DRAFT_1327168 [Cyathus striatus]
MHYASRPHSSREKSPFEFHNIDLKKGEQKSPKHQPFGVVPYIVNQSTTTRYFSDWNLSVFFQDDEGFILYESRAISRYIATKYASQGTQDLIPQSDMKKQVLFEQAASIEVSNFDPYALPVVRGGLFKKMFGLIPDLEIYNKNAETLTAKLDIYDNILSKQKYMAGDSLTLADPPTPQSPITPLRPDPAWWFNDIKSRPAWKAVENDVQAVVSYD